MSLVKPLRRQLELLYNQLLDTESSEEKKRKYEADVKANYERLEKEYTENVKEQRRVISAPQSSLSIPPPQQAIRYLCEQKHLPVTGETTLQRFMSMCEKHAASNDVASKLLRGWNAFWKMCSAYNSYKFVAAQAHNTKKYRRTLAREEFAKHCIDKLWTLNETKETVVPTVGMEYLRGGDKHAYDDLMYFIEAFGLRTNGNGVDFPSKNACRVAYAKSLSHSQVLSELMYAARHAVCLSILTDRTAKYDVYLQAVKKVKDAYNKLYLALQYAASKSVPMEADFLSDDESEQGMQKAYAMALHGLSLEFMQTLRTDVRSDLKEEADGDQLDYKHEHKSNGVSIVVALDRNDTTMSMVRMLRKEIVQNLHTFVSNANVFAPAQVYAECKAMFQECALPPLPVLELQNSAGASSSMFVRMCSLGHDHLQQEVQKLATNVTDMENMYKEIENNKIRDQKRIDVLKSPNNQPISFDAVSMNADER